ncbi:MAG: amidohydrolase, partial [Pseudomonadota bacterium]
GLVNSHTHLPMTLLRGLNDDLRLDVWLGYLMPLERQFVTPEFVRLGTRLGCAEMIRSGITTFADMYYFEEEIAKETAEIGMRALLGQTVIVFPTPDSETYEDGLQRCREFIEGWNGHPLIQPAISPHAWYTSVPELTQACADMALEYDVPIHTHIAETKLEVDNSHRLNHMPVVHWVAEQDLLKTKLLAAHCVHINEAEMFALKEANAGVAHCPTSNLKLASGIAQTGRMVELGLNVGIGTDGPASNNDLDMFEETRLAALLAKTATDNPTTLPARTALELATIGGAKAVHMSHLTGSLEIGKRADLAIIEMDGVHNRPHFHNNPDGVYSRLVYASKSNDVSDVMCNGRWLMQDRVLLTVDEETAKVEAAEVAAKIDAYVIQRESSVYNKLVALTGVQQEESFEVQIKVPIAEDGRIRECLKTDQFKIISAVHYKQYDHYFSFDGNEDDADRLRYREDDYLDDTGKVLKTQTRLTLLGTTARQEFPNAVMLSRSRFLASADRSLRFYKEYFAPESIIEVVKDRHRWHIEYEGKELTVNLDKLLQPAKGKLYLEIKARTWSRKDSEEKTSLIAKLLALFEVDLNQAEKQEYAEIAMR